MPQEPKTQSRQPSPSPGAATASAPLRVTSRLNWQALAAQARRAAPEAFSADGGLLNLIAGKWGHPGAPRRLTSPVDGSEIGWLPMLDGQAAGAAVEAAAGHAGDWARLSYAQRAERVRAVCASMQQHRDTLAGLLVWEIGKTWAAAGTDVDRCIEGVEWYLGAAEAMLHERQPLGLVSNIASWNYPLSVLAHAVLVQVLCGNAAIAKTPTDGGGYAIGIVFALARRQGLPVSLVSGPGGPLSEALVKHDAVDCLSFVGGRATGRDIALNLLDASKRSMLEMEGVNPLGVWDFSQWSMLATTIKKGFDYGRQRCTSYPRFVVQRRLLPHFLETYLSVVKGLRIGHPAAVAADGDAPPTLDFGPLINAKKVVELRGMWEEAIDGGAIPIYEGQLDERLFIAGQDRGAYFAPRAIVAPPRNSAVYHGEPFGPLDTIVVADRVEELIAEMNVSNGSLCASLMTDDEALAVRVRGESQAFKFGHNLLRSRGDKSEPFGGRGESWKGCFVGGRHLVRAVTKGSADETLAGNFPGMLRMPDDLT